MTEDRSQALNGVSPEEKAQVLAQIDEEDLNNLSYNQPLVDIPSPPDIGDLPDKDAIRREKKTGSGLTIKSGIVESEEEAGWYNVKFDTSFAAGTKPVVITVAEGRQGEFEKGSYTPPSHDVPTFSDLSLPDIEIDGVKLGDINQSLVSKPGH